VEIQYLGFDFISIKCLITLFF